MKIQLKKLTITNFKGIKSLEVDFFDQTTITGQNGTGKSSILDAILYLLFDRDSKNQPGSGKGSFCIKPLDKNNNVLPKLENSVNGEFFINDNEVILKKTNREKWSKPRGASEEIFTGNETVYEINGVPKKQKEYNDYINELIDEELFKLLSSPTYFNSLHWEKRREMITSLVGSISANDIVDQMGNVEQGDIITKILKQRKSLTDAKKEVSNNIRRIKDELKLIPARIDEAQRDKPETSDFDAIEKELEAKTKELENLDKQLLDKSEKSKQFYDLKAEKQEALNNLKLLLAELKREHSREFDNKKFNLQKEIDEIKRQLSIISVNDNTKSLEEKKFLTESAISIKRRDWKELHSKELNIDESDTKCKSCGQELPNSEEKKQELKEQFNLNKIKMLERIQTEGKDLKAELDLIEKQIKSIASAKEKEAKEKKELSEKLEKLQKMYDSMILPELETKEYKEALAKIEKAESEIKSMIPVDNDFELQEQKKEVNLEIERLKSILADKTRIQAINDRVEELETEEKKKAQAIADLEKTEFAIQEFTKVKMNYIEQKVNSMFEMVKFKLFEVQINGGEKELCETLVDGVPYNSDLNTGHRILAGLDIIRTFSKHFDVQVPIWIDNFESVTEPVTFKDNQIIFLKAEKGVKTLKIS